MASRIRQLKQREDRSVTRISRSQKIHRIIVCRVNERRFLKVKPVVNPRTTPIVVDEKQKMKRLFKLHTKEGSRPKNTSTMATISKQTTKDVSFCVMLKHLTH